MPSKTRAAFLVLVAVVTIAVLIPGGQAISQEIRRVFVTNFPDVQRVTGTVTIDGLVFQATQVVLPEIVVSPVQPTDTLRMISAGTLTTDGFSEVVLSFSGQVKGEIARPGSVGAILIPDEEPIVRAFEEKGQFQFALEVAADGVSAASPFFASSQPRYTVGFPRYRVYLYNTTDKTVDVDLFAYLTG